MLEDDDVANERRKVLSGDDRHSDNVVVIKNLSKASTLLIRTVPVKKNAPYFQLLV